MKSLDEDKKRACKISQDILEALPLAESRMDKHDLSKLLHDEICEVRMKDSAEFREARWRPASRLFFFIDGDQRDFCTLDQVDEWRPAGVSF